MKTLLAIAAIGLTGLALPQSAEAGHSRVSFTYQTGHSSCGCPVYQQRIFTGYDCYRRPIYRYASVPVRHRCGHSSHSRYSNHNSHNYSRGHSGHTQRGSSYYRSSNRGYSNIGYSRGYSSQGCR